MLMHWIFFFLTQPINNMFTADVPCFYGEHIRVQLLVSLSESCHYLVFLFSARELNFIAGGDEIK